MAIQPASSTSVGAFQTTTSGPAPAPGGRCGAIVLSIRSGMVRANSLAISMICGRLRRLVVISNVATGWIAVGEPDDVGDVRAAPLVDRLVVVADDAQLDLRAGQQLDQPLLGRVDVLVLVDDQVPQLGVDLGGQLRPLQLPYRAHDLLAVGQQPVAVEGLVVGAQHRPERVRHGGGIEQLVLHHVDALEERGDRGEQAIVLDRAAGCSSRFASRDKNAVSWLSSSTS